MSEAYQIMMAVFFEKKERDMRKNGLKEEYKKIIWNEVRNYASNNNGDQNKIEDLQITEHIIVTPFTISQDFNIEEYKIKKNQAKTKKTSEQK